MIPSPERVRLLANQGHLWADDELAWHLYTCAKSASMPVQVLDPLLTTGWYLNGDAAVISDCLNADVASQYIVSAVLRQGHWTPILWIQRHQDLSVHMWEHDSFSVADLNKLHSGICFALGLRSFSTSFTQRSFGADLCGAACVAFIRSMLTDVNLPGTHEQLEHLHQRCKGAFQVAVENLNCSPRPWCWGDGPTDAETLTTLATLLRLHGVPHDQASTRAELVLQSLGTASVAKAIHGGTPWKSLKAIANLQTPKIQLVLPEEQHALSQKSQKGQSKGRQPKSSLRPPALKAFDVDPNKLILAPDSFRVDNDLPIQQLALSQVGPLAIGVALATFADAAPFLRANNKLTARGLALLVLNHPDALGTTLEWHTIRFAAQCAVNQEPVFLTGALVQLGQTLVYQYHCKDGPCVVAPEVACARITVYQDQFDTDWETFHTQPVKTVLKVLQILDTCTQPDCKCVKWHPAKDGGHPEAITNIFRRQYFGLQGKPVSWDKATHYAFLVRYVKELEEPLLRRSGIGGIFMEPRTEDVSAPSSDDQVVWVSGDFQSIQHQAQCEPLSIGIARNGAKFGVRVAASTFQEVFGRLKPDGMFLAPGRRSQWLVGPWPYGMDRRTLAAILKTWGWTCRPMQPAHSVQGGLMWSVQAIAAPAQSVYNMQHGQVVVTCMDKPTSDSPTPEFIGQKHTKELCAMSESSGQDPLQKCDPWQSALSKVPPAVPPGLATGHLHEMESRIEKAILARLPDKPEQMETDAHENRMQLLEQQIQTLHTRQQNMEQHIQEHQAQTATQFQNIQSQMMSQFESHGRQMQSTVQHMLDNQLSKLETVLAKRSRHEWRGGGLGQTSYAKVTSSHRFAPSGFAHVGFHRVGHWFWVFALLILFGIRVGEAAVSGPDATGRKQQSGRAHSDWTLGICNPSGLQGKYQLLQSIGADIIAVSETHLTAESRDKLRSSLHSHNEGYRALVTGAPLPPRSYASNAGSWAGVACVSKCPSRALDVPWPPDLFATSRIQFVSSFMDPCWISRCIIYGYPIGKKHWQAKTRTADILDFAFMHLSNVSGLKYLCGDFNFQMDDLDVFDRFRQHGWVEAQDLYCCMAGVQSKVTCKAKTRKDHLWLNPDLARALLEVTVDDTVFADHSVLRAKFCRQVAYVERFVWPTPAPIDWSVQATPTAFVDFAHTDPSKNYHLLWQSKERSSGGWPRKMKP